MTSKQIIKKLQNAGFDMSKVIETGRNYLEVYAGEISDQTENIELAKQASKITGLNHICNIAYGGYMLSNEGFSIDVDNCL